MAEYVRNGTTEMVISKVVMPAAHRPEQPQLDSVSCQKRRSRVRNQFLKAKNWSTGTGADRLTASPGLLNVFMYASVLEKTYSLGTDMMFLQARYFV